MGLGTNKDLGLSSGFAPFKLCDREQVLWSVHTCYQVWKKQLRTDAILAWRLKESDEVILLFCRGLMTPTLCWSPQIDSVTWDGISVLCLHQPLIRWWRLRRKPHCPCP
jgi:hypothetical protein